MKNKHTKTREFVFHYPTEPSIYVSVEMQEQPIFHWRLVFNEVSEAQIPKATSEWYSRYSGILIASYCGHTFAVVTAYFEGVFPAIETPIEIKVPNMETTVA